MNDAIIVTTRLVAAFGDHRVAEEGLRKLWLYELVEAFKGYAPETVNKALGGVIRTSRYWPTIAEISEGIKATLPKPTLPTFREKVEPDLTPEEVKRRVAAVAAMKKRAGWDEKFGPASVSADDELLGRKPAWPAPDTPFYGYDTEVSDLRPETRALLKKQGLLK